MQQRAVVGALLHAWRGGAGRVRAFLADYAFLIRGLLRLHRATGEARWLMAARELAGEQERRLAAPEGGYFNAGESAELRFRGR
ncbi:MAG: thioredoxin domain-containing protein, partial [Thermoanaerobaculia bacterium]|nr:thioredoxin domain-containing protein [Thermoanaerobaculia bacterium]